MKAIPRFEPVITELSTVTLRMAFMLPSQNFKALEEDDRRQFVMVMFSQGNAGPEMFEE